MNDEQLRQYIKSLAPTFSEKRSELDIELRRSYMAVDWCVRGLASIILRLAHFDFDALTLLQMPEISEKTSEAVKPTIDTISTRLRSAVFIEDVHHSDDYNLENCTPLILQHAVSNTTKIGLDRVFQLYQVVAPAMNSVAGSESGAALREAVSLLMLSIEIRAHQIGLDTNNKDACTEIQKSMSELVNRMLAI